MIQTCFSGDINDYEIEWDERSAMGVVMSSHGYPESYETGEKRSQGSKLFLIRTILKSFIPVHAQINDSAYKWWQSFMCNCTW